MTVMFKWKGPDYRAKNCPECGGPKIRPDQEKIDFFFTSDNPTIQRGLIAAVLFDINKPCPFCGRIEGLYLKVRLQGSSFSVSCPMCCDGPFASTPEGAVEEWNNRQDKSK